MSDQQPISMLLTCPSCGARHIDEGEFATKPHHTHSCQTCGMCWRPAIVPTVGVRFLPGFKNEEPTSEAWTERPELRDLHIRWNDRGVGAGYASYAFSEPHPPTPTAADFFRWCDAQGIVLFPHQRRYAEVLLSNTATRQVMMGGRASGRTFVSETLQRWADETKGGHSNPTLIRIPREWIGVTYDRVMEAARRTWPYFVVVPTDVHDQESITQLTMQLQEMGLEWRFDGKRLHLVP